MFYIFIILIMLPNYIINYYVLGIVPHKQLIIITEVVTNDQIVEKNLVEKNQVVVAAVDMFILHMIQTKVVSFHLLIYI